MSGKEADRIIKDIIDKLNGFEISQRRVFIKTKPTSYYPRGKFLKGLVIFVYDNKVRVLEDKEGPIEIYFSDIISPTDIQEARK